MAHHRTTVQNTRLQTLQTRRARTHRNNERREEGTGTSRAVPTDTPSPRADAEAATEEHDKATTHVAHEMRPASVRLRLLLLLLNLLHQ